MVSDIVKTIKAHLYDRVNSPLFVAFVISWSLWNYRFLMVLVSSLPVHLKFRFIETNLFPDIWSKLLQGGLYPLITTVLIVFVYPFPAKIVYAFWRKRQKDLMVVKQQIEDETPLTIEQSRSIRKEALILELEYEKEIEKRDSQIKNLKNIISSSDSTFEKSFNGAFNSIDPDDVTVIGKNNEISKSGLEILRMLSENENETAFEVSIRDTLNMNTARARHELEKLVKAACLVRTSSVQDKHNMYRLTAEGRALLVANNLI